MICLPGRGHSDVQWRWQRFVWAGRQRCVQAAPRQRPIWAAPRQRPMWAAPGQRPVWEGGSASTGKVAVVAHHLQRRVHQVVEQLVLAHEVRGGVEPLHHERPALIVQLSHRVRRRKKRSREPFFDERTAICMADLYGRFVWRICMADLYGDHSGQN